MLTNDDMLKLLELRCKELGSATEFARLHNLSDAYISQSLSGKHKIGPKIHRALGFRKIVRFIPLQDELSGL